MADTRLHCELKPLAGRLFRKTPAPAAAAAAAAAAAVVAEESTHNTK